MVGLAPDMLECKVRWVLQIITVNKTSGGDGIPVISNPKDDAVKVLHSIYQQIWKTQQWPQEKVSFLSNCKEGQCQRIFKIGYNCTHFTCYQNNAQILKAGLPQYMNQQCSDFQVEFRKGRGIKPKLSLSRKNISDLR